jgi:hypothetical protein
MPRESGKYSNQATDLSAQGSNPGKEKEILFRYFQTPFDPRPDFRSVGTRGSLPWREEVGGGEADHSPPSSAEIKNEWSLPTFALHEGVLRGKF